MKCYKVVLAFMALAFFTGCGKQGEGDSKADDDNECRRPVVISRDFPIAIKYAEVDSATACPTPVIGDVVAALRREIAARCGQGECEEGKCKPESNAVSVLRQLNQFSIIKGNVRECWVVIEAEAETKCICAQ